MEAVFRVNVVNRPTLWKLIFAVFYIFVFLFATVTEGDELTMKMIDGPSSNAAYQSNLNSMDQSNVPTLKMRIEPSNFSGPPHLRRLLGKCFSKVDDSYRYEFCPFRNVTQYEQSIRWNPYSGILGVFQEWEITNNTFIAMSMREGDACGKTYRSVRVLFKCGNSTSIVDVKEPKTCHYELIFQSQLVCHNHSMLVYPTLSKALRTKWDILETRLFKEELTTQGYNKKLRKIFEEAGLCIPSSKKEEIAKGAVEKEMHTEATDKEKGNFESLEKCSSEYKKLKEEIEGLRTLLQLNNGGVKDVETSKRNLTNT